MLITVDIPAESEAAFRALCIQRKIEIQRYQAEGPAGGNPCFDIAVHDHAAMTDDEAGARSAYLAWSNRKRLPAGAFICDSTR